MIDLDSATREELVAYAKDELSLVIPEGLNLSQTKKRIKDELDDLAEATAETEVVEEVASEKPVAKKKSRSSAKREAAPVDPFSIMKTVHIHKSPGDSGANDVFVGVNGKTFLIKRGEDVRVPAPVVEVLRNAVETHATQNKDGSITTREVQSYPFMVRD